MSHCLYLIACEGGSPIKVGISRDLKRRFGMLQTAFPYKLSLATHWPVKSEMAYIIEGVAHQVLADFRLNGEWFSCPATEAKSLIDEMLEQSKYGTDFISYEDFIIAKVRKHAQWEREWKWERTKHGLNSARERGIIGGQASKFTDQQIRDALKEAKTISGAAKILKCAKITIIRRQQMWADGRKLQLPVGLGQGGIGRGRINKTPAQMRKS